MGFEALERGAFDQVVPAGVAYRTRLEQRQALLEMGLRELGATHLRLWLWPPGIEPRNDNDDPRIMECGVSLERRERPAAVKEHDGKPRQRDR